MATIKFLIRSTAKNPDKLSNIQCRFRSGKADLFSPTGLKTHAKYWDEDKECVINTRKVNYVHDVNRKLSEIKAHILKQYSVATGELDKNWLRQTIDKFNNPEKYQKQQKNLFTYIESYLNNNPEKNKKGGYYRVLDFLKDYQEHPKEPFDFEDINSEFIKGFADYLTYEKKLSINYIVKTVKILKTFLAAAYRSGYNKFIYFKDTDNMPKEEESDTIYLTVDEIKQLYCLNLSKNPIWEQIRDVFIVGCLTGLRHSDWNKVSQQNIRDNFMIIKQKKTQKNVVIPLHETVRGILLKYNGVLPSFSKEKINLEIKKIAKKAKLNKMVEITKTKAGVTNTTKHPKHEKIATHTARRSFATNHYKKGHHIQKIMDVTGHRTKDSFLKYIRATEEEEIQRQIDSLNSYEKGDLLWT